MTAVKIYTGHGQYVDTRNFLLGHHRGGQQKARAFERSNF